MTMNNLGVALAADLLKQSEQDAVVTPMDAVLEAARAGQFTGERCFRLLARLWTLKRMMYYVYGGWAQGINLNEYPPSVAYLFGKQTHDESTQEMQLTDEILKRRWVRTQKRLFAHPFGQFGTAPLEEIDSFLRLLGPLQLFVDARNAQGATVRVSEDWTGFFARRKHDLSHVHVLVGSKMVELTVAIARHLSRTGNLIQIYSDPGIFEAQLSRELGSR